MPTLFAFLLGLAAAVPLNMLADVLPPDAAGRLGKPGWPRCPQCGARRRPAEWLALGRAPCSQCGALRRARHLLLELAAGLSLAWLWQWSGGDLFRFASLAVLALTGLLIAVIDLEHRLVLNAVLLPAAGLVFVLGALAPGRGPWVTLLGGLAGYGLALLVFLLGLAFSALVGRLRGQPLSEVAFGFGDVNLAGLVGLATGWPAVILALLATFLLAGAFSALYIVTRSLLRRYTPFAPLPFGPWLVLGMLAIRLYGREIVQGLTGG